MVNRMKISIVCLVETQAQQDNILKIHDGMLPGWEIIHNCNIHWLGKIWICWDPGGLSVSAVDVSEQVLTCVISTANKGSWILSVVYGANQGIDRRRLLQHLVYSKSVVGSGPWLIAGDFNAIHNLIEKWGKAGLSSYDKEFADCILQVGIEDLPFTGCLHTWTNKQSGEDFVSKKIDRVMSNLQWLSRFGNTSVEFLEAGSLGSLSCLGDY
jgi:hypothetical protein